MNAVDQQSAGLAAPRPMIFPWHALGTAGAVTLILCGVFMAWVDEPLARYMHQFADTGWIAAFGVITYLANSGIWYTAALIGMGAAVMAARRAPTLHGGDVLKKRLRAGSFVIVSMVASGLLINAIKLAVGRDRPPELFMKGEATFHPFDQLLAECSFPSGHAQSISAAMIALAWIFPPVRWVCLAVAIIVSFSRIILDAHFLSDITAGAYFAVAVAVILRIVFERDGVTIKLTR